MGVLRKQRRAIRRKLAMQGISEETAQKAIDAMGEIADARRQEARAAIPAVTQEITEKLKKEITPDIYAQAMADSLIMILAFEHIDRRHTGQWLRKWLKEFNAFGEAVRDSGEPLSALIKILREECKFDVETEFAACSEGGATA